MKHYNENFSAYLHDELSKNERQKIDEHLLQCAECRREFDEIKLGANFANHLKQTDAPLDVWNKIENRLDEKHKNLSAFSIHRF